MKIVIPENLELSEEQIDKLNNLGDVKIYIDNPKDSEEWLERVKGADIIGARKASVENNYQELRDVFISCPFVDIGWADEEILAKNNIKIKNSPGCNKESVSEWIIGMMINLFRELYKDIKTQDFNNDQNTTGLFNKKVCILGSGNIGSRVGKICEALEMKVSHFKRGDDLLAKTTSQDIVINCLGTNKSTENLLDKKFFNNLKKDSFFISVSSKKLLDLKAMFEAIDNEALKGVALDKSIIKSEDEPLYQEIKKRDKVILARIAARTDITLKTANDIMVKNIEEYLTKND